ncbi:hypothetical protein ACS0TY_018697 [Phlomoides rotata]
MPVGAYISCNCRSHEFKGNIVLSHNNGVGSDNIQAVNERYLLQRWRKDVYRGYPHMTEEYKKFQEVEKYFH